MKNQIHLGDIDIPILDYAVSCNAILGIRDSGKTVTAKGIAEQLIEADIPIIVFDAVGKWRWMKVAGDGSRGKAYKVVVVGGRQPDLPLNPHGIGEIVRSAIKERIPLVIDLYDPKLSKADWRQIVQQSIRIIHYEANGMAHVFLEEAAEFIPQKVMDGQTYAEVEKLARMGGNASVGITIINQRSQEVNKAVLDLSHNLILGCQIGNKAIEAVEKWVDRLAPEVAKAVTSSLPKLQSGEAWIWTRTNPDDPKREKLPMCRSLHPDRRTPEVVLTSAKPTDINSFVERLGAAIPKLIEEAKQNNPAELRKRIKELENENAGLAATVNDDCQPQVKEVKKEIPIIKEAHLERMEKICERLTSAVLVMSDIVKTWKVPAAKPSLHRETPQPVYRSVPTRQPVIHNNGEASLGKCERSLLGVLAQHEHGCHRRKLILLAGYKWSGSTQNALGKLRSIGAVFGENSGTIQITKDGHKFGPFDPLPDGDELRRWWTNHPSFGLCERKLLSCFFDHPNGLTKDQLLSKTGYEWSGSTQNALGALRTAEVIIGRNNEVMRIADELN